MNINEEMNYFDDDGTPLNPNLIQKPQLCLSCKKNNDPNEEILCNLNRLAQRNDDEFKCHAYEKIDDDSLNH